MLRLNNLIGIASLGGTNGASLVLCVGGGGTGGGGTGGGGAGGEAKLLPLFLPIGSYTVTVAGAGGISSLGSLVSSLGGANGGTGAAGVAANGTTTRNGGGGASGFAGGAGSGATGFAGGSAVGSSPSGGAGARQNGGNSLNFGDGLTNASGNGGAGLASDISGVLLIYGAGGGGGGSSDSGSGAVSYPGYGGGVLNGVASQGAGTPTVLPSGGQAPSITPLTNQGGGGAGAGDSDGTPYAAQSGAAGVVIIRYTTGSMTATGGTITTSPGDTIHTFTTSGTFTRTA